MATIDELLQAASNADKAGDTDAARILVQEARRMMPPETLQAINDPLRTPRAGEGGAPTPPEGPRGIGETLAGVTAPSRAAMGVFADGLTGGESPTMGAINEYAPGLYAPLKRPAAALGDLAGLAVAGAGTAVTGLAGLAGEGVDMVGRGIGVDLKGGQLAGELATMAQFAAPELAGVSSTVRAASSLPRAVAQSERVPTAAQASARAAGDLGIQPALGMTGKTGAMLAAGMEKVPFSGGVIARDAARAVAEIEGVTQRIVSGLGRAMSPDGAGDALQSGLKVAVERFKERASTLFDKVDARVPKDVRFPITSTQKAVAASKEAFAQNPKLAAKLGLNEWDAIMAEAAQNGVPWDALKRFRTSVGEALGSPRGSLADEDVGRLKALYGALTEDMTEAAKSAGNGAYGAWQSANNFYRNGAQRIERSLDGTITAKSPERAWEAFSGLLQRDRSSADITRVREIKQALGDQWGDVAASIVDRLGRARPGQQNATGDAFSVGTFLTEWNKLAPDAKSLLLQGEARAEMDKLLTVMEAAKNAGAERNFSNTGTAMGMGATVIGSAIDLGTTAIALGSANLSARAMTSPIFLRTLNASVRGNTKPLSAMAAGKGPFAADAKTVLQLMGAQSAAPAANEPAAPARIAN
jgi:hypothetical protein